MSSGPGLPGLPLPSRSPAKGTGSCSTNRGRMPAGAAARFMIPSLAPASTTATTCCSPAIGRRSPMSSGSARSTRSSSRQRRRSRLSISPTARAGRCGRRAAPCRGGCFRPSRRVPGTRTRDYLAALRLRRAAPGDTVAAILDRDTTLFRRLWQPLVVAALNTSAEQASAALFSRILAETIGRGAAACRPMLARDGLSESLVDPALRIPVPPRRRDPLRQPAEGARPRARTASPSCDSTAAASRYRRTRMSCLPCRRRSRRGSCPALSCPTITRRSSTPISAMARPRGSRRFSGLSAAPPNGCSASATSCR